MPYLSKTHASVAKQKLRQCRRGEVRVRCCSVSINNMPLKKKKSKQTINTEKSTTETIPGLFMRKTNKQQMLEQWRKGTLFSWQSPKHAEHPLMNTQTRQECWLDHIQTDNDRQPIIKATRLERNTHTNRSPLHHFPLLQVRSTGNSFKTQISAAASKRCDKMICLEKKLRKTAWSQNNNQSNVQSHLTQISGTLNVKHKHLTANDFHKVAGATHKAKTFKQSLLEASQDVENSKYNPFKDMSFCLSPGKASRTGQTRQPKLWKSTNKRRYFESQGHFVPAFLLSSLVQTKQPKCL